MLYASSHLLSSVPFSPFLFSSFSTYTLIFPRILPLSTNPTCLAFLGPFDIQIHAMDSRSKLHSDNSHSSPSIVPSFCPSVRPLLQEAVPPFPPLALLSTSSRLFASPVCSSHSNVHTGLYHRKAHENKS